MTLNSLTRRAGLTGAAGVVLLAAGCASMGSGPSAGVVDEYLLTVTRPGQLHVIDMATNELVRSCDIPGQFGSGAITV